MSDDLRAKILIALDEHLKSGSSAFLDDMHIAASVGCSKEDVQRQLDILESQELVTLATTMGPSYAARIKPQGSLLVEKIKESARTPKKPPIGFNRGGK